MPGILSGLPVSLDVARGTDHGCRRFANASETRNLLNGMYVGTRRVKRRAEHVIYENLAEVAQALGHPHRPALLEHLAQGVRTFEELSARAHLTFANTSRHLQLLRRARLVETERRGKHVLYRPAGDAEAVFLCHQATGLP
jgi:DNA-binding transcriptional ArsR family regulator